MPRSVRARLVFFTNRSRELNEQQAEGPGIVPGRSATTTATTTRARQGIPADRWEQDARERQPDATDGEITQIAGELRAAHYSEMGKRGMAARLAQSDPNAMTAAANSSGWHVSSMARWEAEARELYPGADEEKIALAAAELRTAHYSAMGKKSGQAKRRGSGKAPRRRVDPMAPWTAAARRQHPGATGEEIARVAAELRDAHKAEAAANWVNAAAKARQSPMYINSPQRWQILARQQNPGAGDEEIARVAAELRADYYARLAAARTGRRRDGDDARPPC